MLKQFTWGQYIGLVFLVLAAYYLYVALVYYQVELLAMLKGKGKGAVAPTPAAPASRPSLVGSSGAGALIPKSALAIEAAAAEEQVPEDELEVSEAEDSEMDEASLEEVKMEEPVIDHINNLSQQEEADAMLRSQAPAAEDDFTVGIAQLADYFEDAAGGNITQQELVAQLPELENTDLLVAFFQSNAKAAQQLTSEYYVEVAEPVLD